jgi:cob(I)alamin adenosyltransferase
MAVNLTRVYTKLGDGGETHLGDMSRAPKTHARIEAFGDVDELNAQFGAALATTELPDRVESWLRQIQNDLFDVGAALSVPPGGDEKREQLRIDEDLNRPSDLLFILSRRVNSGAEPLGQPGRGRD